MAREDLHFRLRIPEELKIKIEAAASNAQRSMTAEIVDRLRTSFEPKVDVAALTAERDHLTKELTQAEERNRRCLDGIYASEKETERRIKMYHSIMRRLIRTIDRQSCDEESLNAMRAAVLYMSGVPKLDIDAVSDLINDLGLLTDSTFFADEIPAVFIEDIRNMTGEALRPILDYLKGEGWTVTPPEAPPLSAPPVPPPDDE